MIDRQFQQSHDHLKASKYPKDVELTMYSDLTEGMRKANFYTDYQKTSNLQKLKAMRNCRYKRSSTVASEESQAEISRKNEVK